MSAQKTRAAQALVRQRIDASMVRRRRAETRFRWYGRLAIAFGLFCLVVLFADIIAKGHGAFAQTVIRLDLHYDPQVLGASAADPQQADTAAVINGALYKALGAEGRRARREARALVSGGAPWNLARRLAANPQLAGTRERAWVLADDLVDQYHKGRGGQMLSERQRRWLDEMAGRGELRRRFNSTLFRAGDSTNPEQAGVWGAVMGSFLTLLICLALAFPVGAAAAVYLESYAGRGRLAAIIEVNINNLAAVPSIIYGVLGLALFIGLFQVPRGSPLVGGLVLALMTLPTIIIAGRSAIQSVPPSICEAALGVGASHTQVVFHHLLPLAMPGMLTGTIIGMARALGETAPLLMIGMLAFVADVPSGFTDSATVLPAQIYLWSDIPERAFLERASAAILVLLTFLMAMNGAAVWLRQRLQKRW